MKFGRINRAMVRVTVTTPNQLNSETPENSLEGRSKKCRYRIIFGPFLSGLLELPRFYLD